jgi:DNA-directed RNA polymerase specialized sigma24 family protein
MDPRRGSLSAQVPITELLNDAFEVALRGDREALTSLLSILKTRYGRSIFAPLRYGRGEAPSPAAEPEFQPSVAEFLEEVRGEAIRELPEAERGVVIRFLTAFCERTLEKHRPESPAARAPVERPSRSSTEVRRGPARDDSWKILQGEITALDAFDRLILERYLAGVSFADISRETGRKVAALEIHVTRIKQRLADRLARLCSAAGARPDAPQLPEREPSCAPRRKEILAALEDLPVESQAAIDFVHIRGRTVVELARSLGDRGLEKAQARLELGYESLACRLGIPFPESFEFLKL